MFAATPMCTVLLACTRLTLFLFGRQLLSGKPELRIRTVNSTETGCTEETYDPEKTGQEAALVCSVLLPRQHLPVAILWSLRVI